MHSDDCLSVRLPAPTGNTITTISSTLRNPYTLQFAIGVDQQLFKNATVSVNYLRAQGEHQFYSQNINAPILVEWHDLSHSPAAR